MNFSKRTFCVFLLGMMHSLSSYSQTSITVRQPISTATLDERNPNISGDGKTLIFEQLSRMTNRPELFISFMGENSMWSRPELVPNATMDIKGLINGGYSLNFDGTRLYFHSARYGGLGGSDIWYMDRTSGNTWTSPVNLTKPINSTTHETYPNLSAYGDLLFYTVFTSDKTSNKNPCGKIMMARKKGKDNWDAGVELPASINSGCSCNGKLLPDGKTFVFSSQRSGNKGGYDLYASTWDGNQTWSTPIAIDVLNNAEDNLSFSIPSGTNLVYSDATDKTGKLHDIVRVLLPATVQPEATVLWTGTTPTNINEIGGLQVTLKNTSDNQEHVFYYPSQKEILLPLKTNVKYVLYFQSIKKGFTYDCVEAFASSMTEKIPTTQVKINALQAEATIPTTQLLTENSSLSPSYPFDVKHLTFFLKFNSEVKLQLTDYYVKAATDSTQSENDDVAVGTTGYSSNILYKLQQDLIANGIDSSRLIYKREESDKESYSIKVQ